LRRAQQTLLDTPWQIIQVGIVVVQYLKV
jgi:hypothetical protein